MNTTDIKLYYDTLSTSDRINLKFTAKTYDSKKLADLLEDLKTWLKDGNSAITAVNSWSKYNKGASKILADSLIWASNNSSLGIYDGFTGWLEPSMIIALQKANTKEEEVKALEVITSILRESSGFGRIVATALTVPVVFWLVALSVKGYLFTHASVDVIAIFESLAKGSPLTPTIQSYVEGIYLARTQLLFFIPCLFLIYLGLKQVTRYRGDLFSLYRQALASIFLQNLSILLSNGVRLREALGYLKESKPTPYLNTQLEMMLERISEGMQNNADIIDTGLVPDEIIGRYHLLSQSSSASDSLLKTSSHLAKSSSKKVEGFVRLLSGLLSTGAIGHLVYTYIGMLLAVSDVRTLIN